MAHEQPRPYDPFFGEFFNQLRNNLTEGASEFGTAISLWSLAVSTRSRSILEIGRNTGFSTLALAGALRFLEMGWTECQHNKNQRPEVSFDILESTVPGILISIDPVLDPNVPNLLESAGLTKYVTLVNDTSQNYTPTYWIDLLFIDGDHTYPGCLHDTQKFVQFVRPGGLFILHDYYGWRGGDGSNNSPIKKVGENALPDFEKLLIDTGYQSFTIYRRQGMQMPKMDAQEMFTYGG
ncbi:MAG: class I SAM-dependent methyltransferase [Candidatus Nanopelagicales bacterium]